MSSTHILVFPFPAQGHMLPLLDLTHQLALNNCTVTIVVTPKNLPFLSPILSTHPETICPLILPFPHHPNIPANVENIKDLGISGTIPMTNALTKLHNPLLNWFKSHENPPVAIISDFFLGWTTDLAAELHIPRVTFYSSGAFAISLIDVMWRDIGTNLGLDNVTFRDIPGRPVLPKKHLPSISQSYQESNPDMQCFRNHMLANDRSWIFVFNTFDSLESKYLEHYKRKSGHDRVFGIGPLNLMGPDSLSRGMSKGEPVSGDEVLEWLDTFPESSVVYVCFGSQKVLTNKQAEALAYGLEESGVRFLWAMKPGTTQLPPKFEERVLGRGLVVRGWAAQVSILGHQALGGFLSHCGWNSVLEGIQGGVIILAWPMEADQFLNARLLVEELGVGVRVCEGANSVPNSADVSRVISESMREGGQMKVRARGLKKEALTAISECGSSRRDIGMFVQHLRQLQPQMN